MISSATSTIRTDAQVRNGAEALDGTWYGQRAPDHGDRFPGQTHSVIAEVNLDSPAPRRQLGTDKRFVPEDR